MAVITKTLIDSKIMEAAQTTQYTAVLCKAIIDKFTATNYGTANATISVNLIPVGGTAGNDNLIIDARVIAPGETYTFPALVGHGLEAGDFISTAGTATSLTIRCQGREIT